MGLALDEPRDDDRQIHSEGVTFLVGRDLQRWLPRGRALSVDYNRWWRSFDVALEGQTPC